MSTVDSFAMHAKHRGDRLEHRQWLEDIARWREEHHRVTAMLVAIKSAWDKAELTLEELTQQIRVHEEHINRHEQVFRDHDWIVPDIEDESIVTEHQESELAHTAARQAHETLRQLHTAVMSEVFELLKVTQPDAVVLETG